jgi:hypothetical protein
MSKPKGLDEFLEDQGEVAGFTATLEPVPDKSTHVKVTPFRDGHGCGCESSFELPKDAIRSVTPTGNHHFCCGKSLRVAVVEFAEGASIPVADLVEQMSRASSDFHAAPTPDHLHAMRTPDRPGGGNPPPHPGGSRPIARIGFWDIPWTNCSIEAYESCIGWGGPSGFECLGWEQRYRLVCNGRALWPTLPG